MQEGRPEAVMSAPVEQLEVRSMRPESHQQDAKAAPEKAAETSIDLNADPVGAEDSAERSADGGVGSDTVSGAADQGPDPGNNHAEDMEGSSARDASTAPSSSSNTPEQWAEASHTDTQDAGAADSGWATVKPPRRRTRRQAENAAPANPHQATDSAAAPLRKLLPLPSASRASGREAHSPEAVQSSHDTQVGHSDYCGAPTSSESCACILRDQSEGQGAQDVQLISRSDCQEDAMLLTLRRCRFRGMLLHAGLFSRQHCVRLQG